jgi:hypothetical protein
MVHQAQLLAPKYTTLDVAAARVGLSVCNLEIRIARGQLAVFKMGRRRLVLVEDLDRMVESGRVALA